MWGGGGRGPEVVACPASVCCVVGFAICDVGEWF